MHLIILQHFEAALLDLLPSDLAVPAMQAQPAQSLWSSGEST